MVQAITLTTDFGSKDPYVGAMKGVVYGINPKANIIDITHDVPAFDVDRAAFFIGSSFSYFPRGTIHVVVVDPGVGSSRRPLLLCTENYYFVAPDNGVLTLAAAKDGVKTIFDLDKQEYHLDHVSSTFHGRDVFAPIAAHLSDGISPKRLGTKMDDYVRLDLFGTKKEGNNIRAKIIHIDHYGNGITGIPEEVFKQFIGTKSFSFKIRDDEFKILHRTYVNAPIGDPMLVVGGSGFLEVSVNQGSYKNEKGIMVGDEVVLSIGE